MLTNFFGCCPLRTAVKWIAILNIFISAFAFMEHFRYRKNYFGESIVTIERAEIKQDSIQMNNENVTDNENLTRLVSVPLLNDLFMDYILILLLAKDCVEFYLNLSLIHATFKIFPQTVYSWLVIHYIDFIGMIVSIFINYLKIYIERNIHIKGLIIFDNHFFEWIALVILTLELYVVHSYYIQEKFAAANDIIQLRWKYVPKNKMSSTNRVKSEIENTEATEENNSQGNVEYIPRVIEEIRQSS